MRITGKSLSKGHREIISDKISLNLLKASLEEDKDSWLSCDVLITNKAIIIAGVIYSKVKLDVNSVVDTILKNYYNYKHCTVVNLLEYVDNFERKCSVNGYGIKRLVELEKVSNLVARKLVERARMLLVDCKSDIKALVTIEYTDRTIVRHVHLEIKIQDENQEFYNYVVEEIVEPIIMFYELQSEDYEIRINGTERFLRGDSNMRAGVCGYTLIYEDEYNEINDKEMSNIERVAEAMARFLAMEIISKEFADECYIELEYGDNVDGPDYIKVETFNTNRVDEGKIYSFIENHDLSINGIVDLLDIRLK